MSRDASRTRKLFLEHLESRHLLATFLGSLPIGSQPVDQIPMNPIPNGSMWRVDRWKTGLTTLNEFNGYTVGGSSIYAVEIAADPRPMSAGTRPTISILKTAPSTRRIKRR
jgi:hypothetical protein